MPKHKCEQIEVIIYLCGVFFGGGNTPVSEAKIGMVALKKEIRTRIF